MTKHKRLSFKSWIIGFVGHYWLNIFLLTVISVTVVGFELLEPWPLKILVDSVFGMIPPPLFLKHFSKEALLLAVSMSFVGIYGFESIVSILETVYEHSVLFKFDFRIMTRLFDKIQNLPLKYIGNERAGDYAYRLNAESGNISLLVIDATNKLFSSCLMVAGIFIIMLKVDWLLSLIALVIAPLLYYSIRTYSGRIEKQSNQVEVSTSALYSYTTEAIENTKLIQSFNHQRRESNLIQRLLKRNLVYQMRHLVTNEKFSLTNDSIATGAMALLVLAGASRVLAKGLSVGDLLVFLTYLSYLYGPLQTLSDTISASKSYVAAAKRVFNVYTQDQGTLRHGTLKMKHTRGSISFSHVTSYYRDHKVLDGINLVVNPGEKIGIIGGSGQGKTTLINLLPRFYEYHSGSITIDNVSLQEIELSNLREQFSIVSQDAQLLNTSVWNNLLFARDKPRISRREIIRATKAANAYDFIQELPHKFATVVGQNGDLLSGGQKQRIAIARAFLRDAPILLLDEPTTGLDEASLSVVIEAIDRLIKNRTTIIVSHTLGILRNTDHIYVLKNGRIMAKTTYRDLVKAYMAPVSKDSSEISTIFKETLISDLSSE